MFRRLHQLGVLACGLALLTFATTTIAAPQPSLVIEPTALGNIWSPGEPAQFRITTPPGVDKVAWSVADFHGAVVAHGEQSAPWPSMLAVKLDKVGYFALTVRAGGADSTNVQTTSFAIVPNYNFAVVDDSPFGICTHFGQGASTQIIPLLVRAGIKEIRDEQYWAGVEKTQGTFIFPGDDQDYLKKLAAAHINPHIGLTYSNPLYDGGNAPYDDQGFHAYGRYAAQLVAHYRGVVRTVEVWNEWNSPGFCPGPAASTPEAYRGMLEAAYRAVKDVDPRIQVVGCSTTGLWWGGYAWLHRFVNLPGALTILDAVSTHPYNTGLAPEYLAESMAKVNAMINDAGGPAQPIWITEIGWPVNSDQRAVADQVYESLGTRVNDDVQALYIVRTYAVLLASGAQKVFWYDFMNDGNDPANGEHNFGLIRHPGDSRGDYAPKPGYVALATMTRQLTGTQFIRQEQATPGMRCFLFRRDGQDVRVVWSLEPTVFRIGARGAFTVVDLMGQPRTLAPQNGEALLPVRAGEPFYLLGPVDQVAPGLTIQVENHTIAAEIFDEPIDVAYAIDNTSASPLSGTLEFGGKTVAFTAAAHSQDHAHLELPAGAVSKSATIPCQVSAAGLLLDTVPVQIKVEDAVTVVHAPYFSDSTHMVVTLRNNSRQRATTVQRLHWKAGDTEGESPVGVQIEPLHQADVTIPDVHVEPYTILPLTLGLGLDANNRLRRCDSLVGNHPIFQRTIRLDHPLEDCADLPAIDLTRHGLNKLTGYKGPADLSGSVWLAYDQQNFYLVARIVDDVHYQPFNGADVWSADSIQFALSPVAPWQTKDFYEFSLALTPQGPQVYQFSSARPQDWPGLVKDAPCTIVRTGTQTVYAVAIPRRDGVWPAQGSPCIGVSLLVNDNDGAGRKGWIEWSGGMAQGKNPLQFSPCYLAPAPIQKP
jgi:hypothetical protein